MTTGNWNTWLSRAVRCTRVVAIALAAGAAASIASAEAPKTKETPAKRGDAQQKSSDLWVRTTQTSDRKLHMEVASRLYERKGGGPRVMLAGAVHIGDKPYYAKLQKLLDENDVVLFEGVSPAGSERFVPADAEGRAALTKSRLRLVATMMHEAKQDGDAAASITDLEKQLEGRSRALNWLEIAKRDAWGKAIEVVAPADGEQSSIDLRSAGPNGRFEPRTDSDDIYFSDQDPLSSAEIGEGPGLQQKLAKSLGLVFQLDEMDSDAAHWRNTDMSASELTQRFEEAGLTGEGDGLFAMLEGTGLPAQLLGLVLGVIEHFPGAQPRAKMMLMDMLTHADDLLELGGIPGMEGLMEIIIEDRNKVVIEELVRIVESNDAPETIGIIYGAGHLPDLEERMMERLGYTRTKERWLSAIELDLKAEGISRMERALMKRQLDMQLEMMRKQARATRRGAPI